MRRIVLSTVGVAAIALTPGVALARHGHGAGHRHHHHARVRVEVFRGAAQPGSGSSGSLGSGGSPNTPASTNAGTIASFANGVLTIKLADGSNVSGMVTRDTEIECTTAQDAAQASTADHGGPSGNDGSDNGSATQTQPPTSDNGAGDQNAADGNGVADDQNDAADDPNDAAGNDANQPACGPSSLTAGSAVREAVLRIGPGGSVFSKVELAG
jgi:hypothetical protein